MTRYTLTDDEAQHVRHVTDAVLRHIHARGAKAAFDYDDERQQRFDAHAAEYALATLLGLRWNTLDHLADNGYIDVGEVDEVRHSRSDHSALVLYPADSDDRRYHLFSGLEPTYIHRGWIMGRDAKQPQFWVERGEVLPGTNYRVRLAGYFVRQHHLRPLRELLPAKAEPEPTPPDHQFLSLWEREVS